MLNMKALVGIRIFLWVKSLTDECSGCSLLERNLCQYGVHAKIIVLCKTSEMCKNSGMRKKLRIRG